MPVIEAKRRGPCASCGLSIVAGEHIEYTTEGGPKHLTCTDLDSSARINRHPKPCHLCGELVPKGKGMLEAVEREVDGVFRRTWLVSCSDIAACVGRIQARR
jgi:hypothetical protein